MVKPNLNIPWSYSSATWTAFTVIVSSVSDKLPIYTRKNKYDAIA